MIVVLLRALIFVLILIAIYIALSIAQKRDAKARLEAEALRENIENDARDDYINTKLAALEARARVKRILFVFILPIAIGALLLWLALRT